jgi:LPS-assembly lipoprotein
MWLSSRRGFLSAALVLAGCGLTPVMDPSSQRLYNQILIQAPVNRAEYELVRNLEAQLGAAKSARFALHYELKVTEDNIVVSAAQEISRSSLVGELEYSLLDAVGAFLTRQTAKSFTGYSATGTTVATQRAQRDAYDRLMAILARQVASELLTLDLP